MNTYEIRYVTENGFIESVFIDAPNRVVVWAEFDNMARDFEDKPVGADCFLVKENWDNKREEI